MSPPQQDELLPSPSESSRHSSASLNIRSPQYLTVPNTGPTGSRLSLPGPSTTQPEEPDWSESLLPPRSSSLPVPEIREPLSEDLTYHDTTSPESTTGIYSRFSERIFMSVYSSTSAESEYSVYSNPPARVYRVPSFQNMSTSRRVSTVIASLLHERFPSI